MTSFRLFVLPGCDACGAARALLESQGVSAEIVDLSREPERRPTGTSCTPILEIDGRVRFRGAVPPALLRRFLAAGHSTPVVNLQDAERA